MILPTKHIELKRSLLGIGAVILERLDRPRSVTSLWEDISKFPDIGTFERFSLSLDFLFMIGAVDFHEGLLKRSIQ